MLFCWPDWDRNIQAAVLEMTPDEEILKVEDNPGLDGSSEFYTYLVA